MDNQKKREEQAAAAENYRESGNFQFKRGDFHEAIKLYTESIKQEATVAAYSNRAQAYISLECYDDAIRDAQSALNMEPAHLKARFRLGRAFFCKKMYEKAMKHYEKCLEKEPNNVQVLQAVEQCKKTMTSCSTSANGQSSTKASSSTNGPTTSTSRIDVKPPEFAIQTVKIGPSMFELIRSDNSKQHFPKLNKLQEALINASKPMGGRPIAQIGLFDVPLSTNLNIYKLFKSLDPKMLEGGSLEMHGVGGNDQAFKQFVQLFKPKSVIIDSYSEVQWDFDAHMRHLDPIRNTKLLGLYPLYHPGDPKICHMDSHMCCIPVSQQTVLDWLHSPLASPSHCSPVWNPPKPASKARLVDVLICSVTNQCMNQCQELANVWRHPADKLLCIGEDCLLGAADVDTLIDQCHKLFRMATRPLNYSLKVLCKMGCTKPWCTAPCSPADLMPRAFTNTLGEHLRASVQHLDVEDGADPECAPFPPHDLMIIERFHTS